MHRRDVLLQLSASGFIAGWPLPLSSPNAAPVRATDAISLPHAVTPFAFLTDQAYRSRHAAFVVQIPPNTLLSPDWHVDLRVRSIRAALGAANALLLMEALRDLRAAVHVVYREGEVELIGATLLAERRTLHART